MATYKSEFSQGNGKLKEVAGLQYNNDTPGSEYLSAAVLLKLGAAGFRLDGQTITDVALATGAHTSGNSYIPTKGYVDEAVASVVPGIPGDATYVDYPVTDTSSFTAGKAVAIDDDLVLADASGDVASNIIGIVISRSATSGAGTVRVQLDGQVIVSTDLAGATNGDLLFVGALGQLVSYSTLSANQYAVQAGVVSDTTTDKIILQPRIFGQVA